MTWKRKTSRRRRSYFTATTIDCVKEDERRKVLKNNLTDMKNNVGRKKMQNALACNSSSFAMQKVFIKTFNIADITHCIVVYNYMQSIFNHKKCTKPPRNEFFMRLHSSSRNTK